MTSDQKARPSALVVARHLLNTYGPMELKKLESLLYFAHGHHLALTGQPLFDDEVLAVESGICIPALHQLIDQDDDDSACGRTMRARRHCS